MSNDTLISLKAAFQRLKNGLPIRTKNDGKISLHRINSEAGVSRGAIYYYCDFITETKKEILELEKEGKENVHQSKTDIETKFEERLKKLRKSRDNEKRLKDKYRAEAKQYQDFADGIAKINTTLAFKCLELQNQLEQLNNRNIVSINK